MYQITTNPPLKTTLIFYIISVSQRSLWAKLSSLPWVYQGQNHGVGQLGSDLEILGENLPPNSFRLLHNSVPCVVGLRSVFAFAGCWWGSLFTAVGCHIPSSKPTRLCSVLGPWISLTYTHVVDCLALLVGNLTGYMQVSLGWNLKVQSYKVTSIIPVSITLFQSIY